jgi:hypothetical protein
LENQPTITLTDGADREAWAWFWSILGIGCLLPLLIPVGGPIIWRLGLLSFTEWDRASLVLHESGNVAFYPIFIVLFDWPFLVYAFSMKKRVLRIGSSPSPLRLPISLGLLGLSTPYVFGYAYGFPMEFASGAQDAGQGVGLFLGIFCPVLGAVGAMTGCAIGHTVLAVRRRLRKDDV